MPDQPAPDFEEARRICELNFGYWPEQAQKAVRLFDSAIDTLLREREAREEVIEAARELREAETSHEPDGHLYTHAINRAQRRLDDALAALPATESAQAASGQPTEQAASEEGS